MNQLKQAIGAFWATERAMAITALAGAVEALGLFAWIAARGSPRVGAEGDLSRAATGIAVLALFTVVSAAVLDLSGLSPGERARWRRVFLFCIWYPYLFNALQHGRGLNPRFSLLDSYLEHFGRYVLLIVSQGYVLLYGVLARNLFRPGPGRPPLRLLAARYGVGCLALCFLSGYVMVIRWMVDPFAVHSRAILLSHGISFDGLPVLLGAAWLLERSALGHEGARRWLHAAGAAWLAGAGFWVARAWLELDGGGAWAAAATGLTLAAPVIGILWKAASSLVRLPEKAEPAARRAW